MTNVLVISYFNKFFVKYHDGAYQKYCKFLYIAFVWLRGCSLFYNCGYKQRHNFRTLQFREM